MESFSRGLHGTVRACVKTCYDIYSDKVEHHSLLTEPSHIFGASHIKQSGVILKLFVAFIFQSLTIELFAFSAELLIPLLIRTIYSKGDCWNEVLNTKFLQRHKII